MRQLLAVQVYDGSFIRQGQIPKYVSCWVEWRYLDTGEGELVIDESDPMADLILSGNTNVVPVTVTTANGVRWPGRVVKAALKRATKPGAGVITASLISEGVWLQHMLASQNGSDPSLVGMPLNDTQTGPIASVAAYYINASATRLGVPVAALAPSVDETATVTLAARMTILWDLLRPSLLASGVAMDVDVWLPGDPNDGTPRDSPTIVFTPRPVVTRSWLRWTDTSGLIDNSVLETSSATGYRAILGLTGTDAARVYDEVTDFQSASLYALPEIYVDAGQTAFGADSQQRGLEELIGHEGSAGATFTVTDGKPWSFGDQYREGDVASFLIAGIAIEQQVVTVRVGDDATNGYTVTPTVGSTTLLGTYNPITDAIVRLNQRIRALETGR